MSNIIILSIHKKHSDNILAGKKIYEFRKNKPNKANLPYLVLLYETQNGGGAGAIVGACRMSNTITFTACELETPVMGVWRKALADGGCLTPEELKEYAKGKDVYAWCVSNPIRFKEPLPLKRLGLTRAPMSWHYL